ncbi:MAG: extradiol ring-cleavage dioxygenase [Betaproteobacteria bacterium]|nr:extradiol ring-cleavage dioxygenase [Betaproteobacteria bacterium]
MSGALIATAVTAHVPRMGIEEKAPDFQRGLIAGSKAMGEAIRKLAPDLLVLMSAHWVSTFNWYVTAQNPHKGMCIADEAPDLISGEPYQRPGDPAFAQALAAANQAQDVPMLVNDSPHYTWDYATWVPLHYLDPAQEIPVVTLPSVLTSDLDECRRVGRSVGAVAARSGKRVIFIASCALSHKVARGPHLWPTPERMEMDRKLIALLERGDIAAVAAWLPEYSVQAAAEMGGRVLAAMTGALEWMDGPLSGTHFGDYAQSSGSGNANVLVTGPASG